MRYYFTVKKQCPKCKRDSLTRVKRHKWMRWLPNSKHYECDFCRNNIVLIDVFKRYVTETEVYD